MDRALLILVFLAALGSATTGGIFYGFSSFVMKALGRIAPEQGVAAMNSINVVVINPSFMLVFMGTALVCLALAAGSILWWSEPSGKLVFGAALLYLLGTFGLTVVLHQPMNLKLAAMQPAQAISYWPQYVATWSRWNHVRTAAPLLATALFIAALMMKR
jgi:uncharacterized membrane protein